MTFLGGTIAVADLWVRERCGCFCAEEDCSLSDLRDRRMAYGERG